MRSTATPRFASATPSKSTASTDRSTPAQLDDFADLAEKGAGDIARFTGVTPRKQRILIYLSPRIDISHTYPHYPGSHHHEARVFIDSERVEHHTAPYLHELVHAVVGDGGAMWLEEGFASWVASSVATTYGGYYAPVLSEGNARVDGQARDVLERARGAAEAAAWFDSDSPNLSQRDRRSFYILSHSFTKYLGNTLGTSRLVRIHRADNVHALERITGISHRRVAQPLDGQPRRIARAGGGGAVSWKSGMLNA